MASAGLYTLTLAMREDGLRVDRMGMGIAGGQGNRMWTAFAGGHGGAPLRTHSPHATLVGAAPRGRPRDAANRLATSSRGRFALDILGLPEVIYTDQGVVYLHLNGVTVAQNEAGEQRYLLPDGLGSVRQALDESGQPVSYYEFDPYGNPVDHGGGGGDPCGYTGEWWDSATELLHLRARWYQPETGTFMSKDPVESEPPYLYVHGNPVNHVDPSGEFPPASREPANADPRDLTDWLYREMVENATSPTIRRLQADNQLAGLLALGSWCDTVQGIAEYSLGKPIGPEIWIAAATGSPLTAAAVLHGFTLYDFSQLVKDGAVWDFKDEIGRKLGPGITLRAGGCHQDIEYSVPGNIHFAYVGGAAGILGWEIQAVAGFAEIIDPAHDPNSRGFVDEYSPPNRFQVIGWTPWDPSTINFGDGPEDHEAVTLGIQMWDEFGEGMTRAQFGQELAKNVGRLAICNPLADPPLEYVLQDWARNGNTYPLGYFNNKGDVYRLREGMCP